MLQVCQKLKKVLLGNRNSIRNILVIWQMSGGTSGLIFDMQHGVTREEVVAFLEKVKNDPSYSDTRKIVGSMDRIKELQQESR
jgi:hypothetical protein